MEKRYALGKEIIYIKKFYIIQERYINIQIKITAVTAFAATTIKITNQQTPKTLTSPLYVRVKTCVDIY